MSTTLLVEKICLLDQVGSINPAVTVFTPTEEGIYRLSAYAEIANVPGLRFEIIYEWTDSIGPQACTVPAAQNGSGGESSVTFAPATIHSVASEPFSLITDLTPIVDTPYNFYIIIEKLG